LAGKFVQIYDSIAVIFLMIAILYNLINKGFSDALGMKKTV
jgi:hypothetical protein